eukprot:m.24277 g.24277  ORF g.24277 m.24277 type:complete len:57 (-) comp8580_c1_seq1:59-229(-)
MHAHKQPHTNDVEIVTCDTHTILSSYYSIRTQTLRRVAQQHTKTHTHQTQNKIAPS